MPFMAFLKFFHSKFNVSEIDFLITVKYAKILKLLITLRKAG